MSVGCPLCGSVLVHQERVPPVVARGALTLRSEPVELWWRDQQLPLSPLEAALMELLMHRGRISWKELETLLGISVETRVTLMHRIRQKFGAAGAPDPLETVRYWGLKLRVEDESPKASMASASEPSGPAWLPSAGGWM